MKSGFSWHLPRFLENFCREYKSACPNDQSINSSCGRLCLTANDKIMGWSLVGLSDLSSPILVRSSATRQSWFIEAAFRRFSCVIASPRPLCLIAQQFTVMLGGFGQVLRMQAVRKVFWQQNRSPEPVEWNTVLGRFPSHPSVSLHGLRFWEAASLY